MKVKRAIILLVLFIWVIPQGESFCMSINADGSWSKSITTSNLTSGAGSNLTSTYESSSSQANIDISLTLGILDGWRVDVSKVDGTWHSDVHLYIQRTSNGWTDLGLGTISGGSSYIEVTGVSQTFYSGSGNRYDADVQFKLTGISLSIPAGTYSTTVYITLVNT
ncbi:MAG: hypothetical protein ABFD81_07175 [Syntrophaceae bacterium]